MEAAFLQMLEKLSKDTSSFEQLKTMVEKLLNKAEVAKKQLELLEMAVKDDYDSILITELDLEAPGPKIVYVNEGFTKMTGYTPEEVIGKTPRILQGPKTDRNVLNKLKQNLIEGLAFFGHTVNYRKDGSEFINQWDIHPLTDRNGNVTHWVSYQHDISERDCAEKFLIDANIEFEALNEESKRVYVDTDVQGNILNPNKAFRGITGYDSDELKQIKIWDLIHPEQRELSREYFENTDFAKAGNNRHNWTFVSKAGKLLLFETFLRCLINNGQNIIRVYVENLSLRNKIMDSLRFEDASLNKLLNKKDQFVMKLHQLDSTIVCSHLSESFQEITGNNAKELLGELNLDIIHKDDVKTIEKHIQKAFEGRCSTTKCRIKNARGEYINFIQHFNPVVSPDFEVSAVKIIGIPELEFRK